MKPISGGVTAPQGFKAAGIACGIKKNNQPDLALIVSEQPAVAAGVFTTNKVKAAPLVLSQAHLQSDRAQVIVANSGNANACTGPDGLEAAAKMAAAAAADLQLQPELVLVASTGVIGVPLPLAKIEAGLKGLGTALSTSGSGVAAQAIMTTDTFPKELAVEFEIGGRPVRLGGIAKGSGMIHPNLATMLAFLTTDLQIKPELLQQGLRQAAAVSFNRITVDGDTSTNDCLFILANGRADNPVIETEGESYWAFQTALNFVCTELAKLVVRDGEGATKFVTIEVKGAATEIDAVRAGKAVATSSLVKTALFGEDANWGRILAAVGYSGIEFNPDRVSIDLGDLLVCKNGAGVAFDEAQAKKILGAKEIAITIDLGLGQATATVWTCDLSYDYVKINGSYRS